MSGDESPWGESSRRQAVGVRTPAGDRGNAGDRANADDDAPPTESGAKETDDELELLASALRTLAAHNPFLEEAGLLRSLEAVSDVPGEVGGADSATGESAGSVSGMASERGVAERQTSDFAPSQLGPYRLLEQLGHGGMGTVFKALHPALDKIVAIKLLAPDRLSNREMVERFRREMRAIGRIDHPHIVRALDAGEADGVQYLAMEHVSGIDLSALLKRAGPLPVAEACAVAMQAALGLQAAHARGVVHRDVKPANLMLCEQEDGPAIIKVMDLGVAIIASAIEEADASAPSSALTRDGQILGTLDFMAPEQADGHQTVDHRADVWSLGATLFALLTGSTVYAGRPAASVLQKLSLLANEPVPPVKSRRPDLPEPLARLIDRMLDRRPDARPVSMADVAEALRPFAAGADLAALLTPIADFPTRAAQSTTAPAGKGIANPQQSDGRRLRVRNAFVVVAMVVAAVAGLAALVVSVRTRDGELLVEIPDDVPAEVAKQIQVEVRNGDDIRVANQAAGWTIGVREGRYDVRLTGGNDRFDLRDGSVTVSRDKQAIVRIMRKPAAVAAPSTGAGSDGAQPTDTKPVETAPVGTNPVASRSGYAWPKGKPSPAIPPFDAAQARRHQDEWAKHLGLPREYANSVGMKFVLIPPGEYLRGTNEAEYSRLRAENPAIEPREAGFLASEMPPHTVVLTRPFYLGIHEVTQRQYLAVAGKNPSTFVVTDVNVGWSLKGMDTSRFPVETVDWEDVARYCLVLGQREGIEPKYLRSEDASEHIVWTTGYRLPTEAEWDFACRAGTTTRYWCGDDEADLRFAEWTRLNARGGRPHDVGTLRANPFGLFDMLGNVSELTLDEDDFEAEEGTYRRFANAAAIDPKGRSAPPWRVSRGGDMYVPLLECRSAWRRIVAGEGGADRRGFRVALSVDAVRRLRASKPADDASNVADADKDTAAADRRAAEWLLTLGPGTSIGVQEPSGSYRRVRQGEPLPDAPFRIRDIHLNWTETARPVGDLCPTLSDRLRGTRPTFLSMHTPSPPAADLAKLVALPELSELTTFSLNGGSATDDQLVELAKLPRLRVLELMQAPGVTGRGLAALRDMKELTGLSLLYARLAPKDLDALRFLPALTYLNLDSTPCQGEHLAALARLKLTDLLLHNTGIDDNAAARLSGLTTLTRLSLHTNPLTDEGLAELKSLKQLEELDLTGTATTAAGVADFRKALPDCQVEWSPR